MPTQNNDAAAILDANLPKLSKDQQKAALAIAGKHFSSLVSTVQFETELEIKKIQTGHCQFFGDRIANVAYDDSFDRYSQPRVIEADKLSTVDRTSVMSSIDKMHKLQTKLDAEIAAFEKMKKEHDQRVEALQKDKQTVREAINTVVERHNRRLVKEVETLREKRDVAVAHINKSKSAVEIACLFNGEAKTIGAFLAAMPKGSLVAEAAAQAGLSLPQIGAKAEQKLALVG